MKDTSAAIEILLNGEARDVSSDAVVADLLREIGLDPEHPKGIAVAVNDEVVPKGEWATWELEPSDRVEVITALQGG